MPIKKHLIEGGWILTPDLRRDGPPFEERPWKFKVSKDRHIRSKVGKREERQGSASFSFPFFIQSRTLALGVMPCAFRWVFPAQITLINSLTHTCIS